MKCFYWDDFAVFGQVARLVRVEIAPGRTIPLHDHDGHGEVFWVCEGTAVHRLNGERAHMRTGDVCFIRERDQHQFSVLEDSKLVLMNLAVNEEVIREFSTRYFGPGAGNESPGYLWHSGSQPRTSRLSAKDLRQVNEEARRFSEGPQQRFHLDCFLLNLATSVLEQSARSSLSPQAKPLPDWLASHLARMEAHRPVETLSMERMVTDSGRTHEHLARVMRERMEMSPSEWIRQRRVRWAAHLLALTDKSIIEVSMDCGFNHLSGFYRAFKEHNGCSPGRFRRRISGLNVLPGGRDKSTR